MEKGYLTLKEAAVYLGLAEGTLYNWVHQKRIKYIKLGGIKFSKAYLQDLINKNTINPVRNIV